MRGSKCIVNAKEMQQEEKEREKEKEKRKDLLSRR